MRGDTVFIASSPDDLQRLFNVAADASEERGLSINHKKAKAMCVSKQSPEPKINIKLGDQTIDQVSFFTYLGATITADGTTKKEIRRKIALAKDAFLKQAEEHPDEPYNLSLKIKICALTT